MLNSIYSVLIAIFLNSNIILIKKNFMITLSCIFVLMLCLLYPSLGRKKLKSKRLTICRDGYCQLSICIFSTILIIIADIVIYFCLKIKFNFKNYLLHVVMTIIFEIILFLFGIIKVYIFSKQLGKYIKVLQICTCYIPIVNFVILYKTIKIVKKEVEYENEKLILNENRKLKKICKTKYPILLVHGVFFRDYKYFNYWGRIPEELEKNGAVIYYGNHQSASSVEDSSKELLKRIKSIINETGYKKVNIIAHSKGGLDCKYLLIYPEIENLVASITTISTPHNGCEFADYLFSKISNRLLNIIAEKYNNILKKIGDVSPDFIAATKDLTTESCKKINEKIRLKPNIFCQSVGSKLNKNIRGPFPLNYTGLFVKYFDGANDGLVGIKSFEWGNRYIFIESYDKIGISHGDTIDLNRKNLMQFDVREFYVQLVHDLKKRNL